MELVIKDTDKRTRKSKATDHELNRKTQVKNIAKNTKTYKKG